MDVELQAYPANDKKSSSQAYYQIMLFVHDQQNKL